MRALFFRLRNLFRRSTLDTEIREEVAFHFDALVAENRRRGMTDAEAHSAATRELGGVLRTQEAFREEMTFPRFEALLQDLRYALRGFLRAKGFTFTALSVLGLSIGMNAGLFSILNTLSFRPLPLPGADHLVCVTGYTDRDAMQRKFTLPVFTTLAEQAQGYVDVAAYDPYNSFQLASDARAPAEIVRGSFVSANFFRVLGVAPRFGRLPASERGIVLSHRFWKRRYGGNPAIVGIPIRFNALPFTVAGVMPADFQGPDLLLPDAWIPLQYQPELQPNRDLARWLILTGRVGARFSREQATAVLSTIVSRAHRDPADHEGIARIALSPAVLFPLNAEMAPFAVLLMLPTALVLLISCANLANLLLGRAAIRSKEIATRLALGATRGRLVRQLLTESVVLATAGGLVGVAAASELLQLGSHWLLPFFAAFGTISPDFSLDARVLTFTLAVSFVAAIACGLAPALHASRGDLGVICKQDRGSLHGGKGGAWLRNVLMSTQVAVCTILLVAAGLMVRSFRNALVTEPGFATEGIMTLQFNLKAAGYTDTAAQLFHRNLRGKLEALPHVRSVAQAASAPLSDRPSVPVYTRAADDGTETYRFTSTFNRVSPDYFRTLGIPLVSGRTFTPREASENAPVALISEAAARRLWPGEVPLGNKLRLDTGAQSVSREIIGVVRDTRSVWLSRVDESYIYLPFHSAEGDDASSAMLVRLDRDHPSTRASLDHTFRTLDSTLPFQLAPLTDIVDRWRLLPLAASAVASCLGVIALFLAGIGLYGVTGYLVSQRRNEFGIRIALGATRSHILTMVFAQGFRVVSGGLLAGVAVSVMAARFLMSSFYGLSPYDPAALLFVTGFLAIVVLAAMYRPARLATRVDPAVSLRNE
ncbi:MAG: ABC transporter permease [Acidobacteriota bacterium]